MIKLNLIKVKIRIGLLTLNLITFVTWNLFQRTYFVEYEKNNNDYG